MAFCNHDLAWSAPIGSEEIQGPVYIDACNHLEGSYIGSVQYDSDFEGGITKLDVYIFDHYYGQGVCIRYGSDDGDYISPGKLLDMLCLTELGPSSQYMAARWLIDQKMAIKATRR